MKRRTFLAGLGAAAAWPIAKADESVPRVGCLGLLPGDLDKPLFGQLEAGLRALGYVPGKTIEIDFRPPDAPGEDRLEGIARDLVDRKVDVIVTGGPGVLTASRVISSTPIVAAFFGEIDELVAMGIVASLAHPGGNVTGETFLPTR